MQNGPYRIARIPEVLSTLLPQQVGLAFQKIPMKGAIDNEYMIRLSPLIPPTDPGLVATPVGYLIVVGQHNGPLLGSWYSDNPKDASEFYESMIIMLDAGKFIEKGYSCDPVAAERYIELHDDPPATK